MAAVAMPEVVSFSNIPKSALRQSITTIQFAIFNSFLFLTKLSSIDQNELLYLKHYNAGVDKFVQMAVRDSLFLKQHSISIVLILHPLAAVAMPEVVPFSIAPKSAVPQLIKNMQLNRFKFDLFMTKLSSIDQNELLYIQLITGAIKFVQIVARASFFLPIFHPMADVAMQEVVSFSIVPKSAIRQSIKTIQFVIFHFYPF